MPQSITMMASGPRHCHNDQVHATVATRSRLQGSSKRLAVAMNRGNIATGTRNNGDRVKANAMVVTGPGNKHQHKPWWPQAPDARPR